MLRIVVLSLSLWVTVSLATIKVAVTIDDLPTHGALPKGVTREDIAVKMLASLKKHGVPEAYAFINAGKVEVKKESFEVLKLWQAAGYPFGNHTYLHESIDEISVPKYEISIAKNEPMLRVLGENQNWHYFRYTFLHEGATLQKRNAIRDYLRGHGYTIAQVTIDFEDWSWNNPYARCKNKAAHRRAPSRRMPRPSTQIQRRSGVTSSRSLQTRSPTQPRDPSAGDTPGSIARLNTDLSASTHDNEVETGAPAPVST